MTDANLQDPEASEPVWQNPPARAGSQAGRDSLWAGLLQPFLDNPGQWGIARSWPNMKSAERASSNLKRWKHKPPGIWEFTSRTTKPEEAGSEYPEGRSDLYVRYVGLEQAVDQKVELEPEKAVESPEPQVVEGIWVDEVPGSGWVEREPLGNIVPEGVGD